MILATRSLHEVAMSTSRSIHLQDSCIGFESSDAFSLDICTALWCDDSLKAAPSPRPFATRPHPNLPWKIMASHAKSAHKCAEAAPK